METTFNNNRSLKSYLAVASLAGVSLFGFGMFAINMQHAEALLLYLFVAASLATLNNVSFKIHDKICFLLSEPIYTFAAVLLNPLEQAVPVFIGSLIAELYYYKKNKKNFSWFQLLFNPSNFVISNFFASLFFHSTSSLTEFNTVLFFVKVFAVIIIFQLVNSFLVSLAISLEEKFSATDIMTSVYFTTFLVPSIFNFLVSGLLFWSFLNNQILVMALAIIAYMLVGLTYQKEGRLQSSKTEIVNALLQTLGARDYYTKKHSLRVAELSALVAKEMKLPYKVVKNVEFAALLHDLGKINFPDKAFTQKHLDRETWKTIINHPEVSSDILKQLSEFEEISRLVHLHHERFDGSGYPEKLAGEEIPIEARIIAVVDSFDAMTSHRTYRRAFPVEYAIKEISDYSGVAYDPKVVEAFIKVLNRVLKDVEERLKEEELKYKVSISRRQ